MMNDNQNIMPLRRRAFTLIEIMVAVVIIVLLIGMALPVFRVITGSRSEAGASNIIAATLSRARADAVGLQQPIGIAFLYNPSTQKNYMAEVELASCPAAVAGQTVLPYTYVTAVNGTISYYYINNTSSIITLPSPPPLVAPSQGSYYGLAFVGGPPLEIMPSTDLIAVPTGIGVQTICNCSYTGSVRATDGYLSVGVIFFDGKGRVATQNYGISQYSKLLHSAAITGQDYPVPGVFTSNQYGVGSQYGLVVFQKDAFVSQNFSPNDPAYFFTNSNQANAYTDTTNGPSQQAEENWLDQNATPLLIDRYTGTLIKGE